jgi:hypothetical protein
VGSLFPPSIWGQVGSLSVDVEPAGAVVELANPKQPVRTCLSPCKMTRLRPDTYEVRVTKAGYQPWTGRATLVPGENAFRPKLEAENTFVGSGLFWLIVAVGTAAGAVAGYFIFKR